MQHADLIQTRHCIMNLFSEFLKQETVSCIKQLTSPSCISLIYVCVKIRCYRLMPCNTDCHCKCRWGPTCDFTQTYKKTTPSKSSLVRDSGKTRDTQTVFTCQLLHQPTCHLCSSTYSAWKSFTVCPLEISKNVLCLKTFKF